MKLFQDVPESFLHHIQRDKILVDLENALAFTNKDPNGAVIAQISIPQIYQQTYRITGIWIPKEVADKILTVINEWRESKGIPRKSA